MADSSSSSNSSKECTKECNAACYITLSILLAFISFTLLNHSRPQSTLSTTHELALNVSRALRDNGNFTITATLIHLSPELFFANAENSTVFAIQDSTISNLSISHNEMRQLVKYHTAPFALSKKELFKRRVPFCFKTMLQDKNLVVTEADSKRGVIKINNVSVSWPDLFVQGSVVVHGVSGVFDVVSSVSCGFENPSGGNVTGGVEWSKVVKVLSLNGFVSYAIGLNAVLDGIVRDYPDLGNVTVFVPPNSGFISSDNPFLERIVRIHVLKQRFSYMELSANVGKSTLRTLVNGYDLKIDGLSGKLSVNGVEIVAPDIFSSDKFVVHGISRAFDTAGSVHVSNGRHITKGADTENSEQRINDNFNAFFTKHFSTVPHYARLKENKDKKVHVVSRWLVPSGPNPLHN